MVSVGRVMVKLYLGVSWWTSAADNAGAVLLHAIYYAKCKLPPTRGLAAKCRSLWDAGRFSRPMVEWSVLATSNATSQLVLLKLQLCHPTAAKSSFQRPPPTAATSPATAAKAFLKKLRLLSPPVGQADAWTLSQEFPETNADLANAVLRVPSPSVSHNHSLAVILLFCRELWLATATGRW